MMWWYYLTSISCKFQLDWPCLLCKTRCYFDGTSLFVQIVVILQISRNISSFRKAVYSEKYRWVEISRAVTGFLCCELWIVIMNCEQGIDADKVGGNETLIPLQGFGFFSPCALEKIQSLFEVQITTSITTYLLL